MNVVNQLDFRMRDKQHGDKVITIVLFESFEDEIKNTDNTICFISCLLLKCCN